MIVTVEGVITSIATKEKDGKVSTELMLVQKGEKEQVTIRLQDDVTEAFEEYQRETFTGRLMTWQTRNGVGSMIMVETA
ncbi:hypothetical protein [Paenibacillus harenae]|uniref:Uncharacterized protein (DUF4415 family) n=1 Tax=Paenibacillus harenae TaxID=306543 RepID=A0ABT9UB04_PAEHA|nr:hypothetical protein [Paenibacillus harenae]MDQ0116833.1 uncharacterized protein (DUF4415 family) [Paenibacillus harenae]